jgi:hypothetical protein
LVGALGLAGEADLFLDLGEGKEWESYFDSRYHLAISKALSDIDEYGEDIWSIAAVSLARTHFASMVEYHASWGKIAIKGSYRQKEAAPYIQNRYEEALQYFKR